MSMRLVLIKVSQSLLDRLVASKGALLIALSENKIAGFSRPADVEDSIDYRDISVEAEDPDSLIRTIIDGGVIFSNDLQWAYTHPAWHSVDKVKALARELPAMAARHRALEQRIYPDTDEADIGWPAGRIADFFTRAAAEGKAVVVGVA